MQIIKAVQAAVTPIPIGNLCGGNDSGLGPFAQFFCSLDPNAGNERNNAIKTFASFAFLISNIIGILSVVAGLMFIIQFIIGGLNWITSSGDKTKLEKAQQTLLNSAIGLIIVLGAYALISLVAAVLGFDILLNNPEQLVDSLRL